MTTTSRCPLCSSTTVDFLERRGVPIHQNRLMPGQDAATRGRARRTSSSPTAESAGSFATAHSTPPRSSTVRTTTTIEAIRPAYEDYLDELVRYLVEERDVHDARIVEVGCGDGHFLEKLVARSPGSSGYGFDPSYRGPSHSNDGRVRYEKRFYASGGSEEPADVVICRHVIEHLPDPMSLLGRHPQESGEPVNEHAFFSKLRVSSGSSKTSFSGTSFTSIARTSAERRSRSR